MELPVPRAQVPFGLRPSHCCLSVNHCAESLALAGGGYQFAAETVAWPVRPGKASDSLELGLFGLAAFFALMSNSQDLWIGASRDLLMPS